MYPELFRIYGFPINTYGVLLAMAFLAALLVSARLAQRDGIPRDRVYDLGLWMLLAALVGSKILMLWTEPVYREHPLQFISLDFLRSGGVFYGGFIGAALTGYFLIRHYGIPWWRTADAFAPGIALGQAIGRQGCFAAGCCWGKATSLPWGVRFTSLGHEITGVPIDVDLHPTQLYESFAMLALFFLLLWMHGRRRFSGQIILMYALLYSITRFSIEFFRDDPRGDVMGLTTLTGLSTSQLISMVVGTAAAVILLVSRRRVSRNSQSLAARTTSANASS